MTVRDLIEELECLNPDAEIKIAYQPYFPLYLTPELVVEKGSNVYIAQPPHYSKNGYLDDDTSKLLGYK